MPRPEGFLQQHPHSKKPSFPKAPSTCPLNLIRPALGGASCGSATPSLPFWEPRGHKASMNTGGHKPEECFSPSAQHHKLCPQTREAPTSNFQLNAPPGFPLLSSGPPSGCLGNLPHPPILLCHPRHSHSPDGITPSEGDMDSGRRDQLHRNRPLLSASRPDLISKFRSQGSNDLLEAST